ncbi:hypothetical protein CXG81DRAFT_26759 [Caulochytrium protostelioides]|uniref:Nuclear pore complex protein Nup85 n=1 Tax=Caulochytrium protostelioides TaxID=1555241 RepID=A0A4P9X690_9FUNG|nr:hypothetical protein CXG81DRAFT_26759 [Caulochytrium protostelioides]|eukprot:RKP00530.1 hypothetical protein CXG81DRAFT_26759 [Caulochytrium protostelioides]
MVAPSPAAAVVSDAANDALVRDVAHDLTYARETRLGICPPQRYPALRAQNRGIRIAFQPAGPQTMTAFMAARHAPRPGAPSTPHHPQDQNVYSGKLLPAFAVHDRPFIHATLGLYMQLQQLWTAVRSGPKRARRNGGAMAAASDADDDGDDAYRGGSSGVPTVEDVMAISRSYREEMRRAMPSPHAPVTRPADADRFALLHRIWHLMECLIETDDLPGAMLASLLAWRSQNRPHPLLARGQLEALLATQTARSLPGFWPVLETLLVRGDIRSARQLLTHALSESSASAEPILDELRHVLETLPDVGQAARSQTVFIKTWNTWHHGVVAMEKRVAADLDDATAAPHYTCARADKLQIARLLRIMEGRETAITEAAHDWCDAMLALAFYTNPLIKVYELIHPLSRFEALTAPLMDASASTADAPPSSFVLSERILIHLLRWEINDAVRHSSNLDWWLGAHLQDMLAKLNLGFEDDTRDFGNDRTTASSGTASRKRMAGAAAAGDAEMAGTTTTAATTTAAAAPSREEIREGLIVDYSQRLLQDPATVAAGRAYLETCPVQGGPLLYSWLERQTPDQPLSVTQLLYLCQRYHFRDVARRIHLVQARRAKDEGLLADAICHALDADAPELVETICTELMTDYLNTDDRSGYSSLVVALQDTRYLTAHPFLVFLNAYDQFQRAHDADRSHDAAQQLWHMLAGHTATGTAPVTPPMYEPLLLLKAVPLLEDTNVPVFNAAQTRDLMACLETFLLRTAPAPTPAAAAAACRAARGCPVAANLAALQAPAYPPRLLAVIGDRDEFQRLLTLALTRNLARALVM